MTREPAYVVSVEPDLPFDEAVAATRAALSNSGFGVLCEIDVQATMKAKLGLERDPYLILGACNPALAHRALAAEPDLGALLPCNVVVMVRDGRTRVAAVAAETMLGMVGNPALSPVAGEVGERLRAVLDRVAAAGAVQPGAQ